MNNNNNSCSILRTLFVVLQHENMHCFTLKFLVLTDRLTARVDPPLTSLTWRETMYLFAPNFSTKAPPTLLRKKLAFIGSTFGGEPSSLLHDARYFLESKVGSESAKLLCESSYLFLSYLKSDLASQNQPITGALNLVKSSAVVQKFMNTGNYSTRVVSERLNSCYYISLLTNEPPVAIKLPLNGSYCLIFPISELPLWTDENSTFFDEAALLHLLTLVNQEYAPAPEFGKQQLVTYDGLPEFRLCCCYLQVNLQINPSYLNIKLNSLLKKLAPVLFSRLYSFWYFLIGGAKNDRLFSRFYRLALRRLALRLSHLTILSTFVVRR